MGDGEWETTRGNSWREYGVEKRDMWDKDERDMAESLEQAEEM